MTTQFKKQINQRMNSINQEQDKYDMGHWPLYWHEHPITITEAKEIKYRDAIVNYARAILNGDSNALGVPEPVPIEVTRELEILFHRLDHLV